MGGWGWCRGWGSGKLASWWSNIKGDDCFFEWSFSAFLISTGTWSPEAPIFNKSINMSQVYRRSDMDKCIPYVVRMTGTIRLKNSSTPQPLHTTGPTFSPQPHSFFSDYSNLWQQNLHLNLHQPATFAFKKTENTLQFFTPNIQHFSLFPQRSNLDSFPVPPVPWAIPKPTNFRPIIVVLIFIVKSALIQLTIPTKLHRPPHPQHNPNYHLWVFVHPNPPMPGPMASPIRDPNQRIAITTTATKATRAANIAKAVPQTTAIITTTTTTTIPMQMNPLTSVRIPVPHAFRLNTKV